MFSAKIKESLIEKRMKGAQSQPGGKKLPHNKKERGGDGIGGERSRPRWVAQKYPESEKKKNPRVFLHREKGIKREG